MCAKCVYWDRECEKYGAGKKTLRNINVLIYSPNTLGLFSVCITPVVCVCVFQTDSMCISGGDSMQIDTPAFE